MPIIGPESRIYQAGLSIRKAALEQGVDIFSYQYAPPLIKTFLACRHSQSKLLGHGRDVFTLASKKGCLREYVYAINYNQIGVKKAKDIYYRQKILTTLFPHNFARIYFSAGTQDESDQEHLTGTIRQRIFGKFLYLGEDESEVDYDLRLDRNSRYPFTPIRSVIYQLDLPVSLDNRGENFIVGNDGGVYYIDIPTPLLRYSWPKDRILHYMQDHRYSNSDIATVARAIDRL